jgi:hypothetical protein
MSKIVENISTIAVHLFILFSLSAFIASYFIPLIVYRMPLRAVSCVIFALALFAEGYLSGYYHYKDKLEEAEKKTKTVIQTITKEVPVITEKVVTKYVDKVNTIKEKGDVITKFVSVKDDSDCKLHNSFIVLHDAAAANVLPDPTGATDETPSEIQISQVARTVTGNYTSCNEAIEQLKELQEWVKLQKANNP